MLIPPHDLKETADKYLEIWDDICKELNIPHLLIDGTSLGFYRDGGYIEKDNDVDVRLICNKEKWEQFKKIFINRTKARTNHPSGTSYIWGVPGGHLLFCIERSPVVGIAIHDTGKEILVPKYYNKFDTIDHNGRKYNIPSPIEEYLEVRYGPTWKTPNPKWAKRIGQYHRLTLNEKYLGN